MRWLLNLVLKNAPKLLRRADAGRKLVVQVRDRSNHSLFQMVHERILHDGRKLTHAFASGESKAFADAMNRVCESVAEVATTYFEIPPASIFVTVEVISQAVGSPADWETCTFASSSPPGRFGQVVNHGKINRSSKWSSLFGVDDGENKWKTGFRSYSCNDTSRPEFICEWDGWKNRFNSVLVVPIRSPIDEQDDQVFDYGLLVLQSPRKHAFEGIPDSHDFVRCPHKYNEKVDSTSGFHIMALTADIIGLCLMPAARSEYLSGEGELSIVEPKQLPPE